MSGLNLGNACYCLLQNLLSSSLLFTNIKINNYSFAGCLVEVSTLVSNFKAKGIWEWDAEKDIWA